MLSGQLKKTKSADNFSVCAWSVDSGLNKVVLQYFCNHACVCVYIDEEEDDDDEDGEIEKPDDNNKRKEKMKEKKAYTNTYDIPENEFHKNDLLKSIKSTIRRTCNEHLSQPNNPNHIQLKIIIKEIANVIKTEIKLLKGMERYRIISTCSFIAGTNFSGRIGSGFLWNPTVDNYVDYTHKLSLGSLYCSVYMVNFE